MGMASSAGFGAGPRTELLLGVLMIIGFASSTIHGMLYKIVPFLAWLHLHETHEIRDGLPNMKEIMPDAHTLPHLWIHSACLVLVSIAIIHPGFWVYPAAASIALSWTWLAANLWLGWWRYRRVL